MTIGGVLWTVLHDLARVFLGRWEQLNPPDESAARNRIRLEMASGAYGVALKCLDQMLAANSTNQWAITQREKTLTRIHELNAAAQSTAKGTR